MCFNISDIVLIIQINKVFNILSYWGSKVRSAHWKQTTETKKSWMHSKVPNFGIPQWGSKGRMDKSSERVKLPLLLLLVVFCWVMINYLAYSLILEITCIHIQSSESPIFQYYRNPQIKKRLQKNSSEYCCLTRYPRRSAKVKEVDRRQKLWIVCMARMAGGGTVGGWWYFLLGMDRLVKSKGERREVLKLRRWKRYPRLILWKMFVLHRIYHEVLIFKCWSWPTLIEPYMMSTKNDKQILP